MDLASSSPADPILGLLENYASLNLSTITTLPSLPSPLEFLRFVAQNRPFVIRGGAADWKAVQEWNVATLKTLLEGVDINVAVTPFGSRLYLSSPIQYTSYPSTPQYVDMPAANINNTTLRNADSPVLSPSGELLFVKPHEEQQPFSQFLDFIIAQEKSLSSRSISPSTQPPGGEVRYAQTQNDNLPNEYALLSTHVPPSIPFSRIALNSQPDAVNLWIGNSLSTTALHKDNYENIYVQIIGRKTFLLIPPIAWSAVAERPLRPASYARLAQHSPRHLPGGGFEIVEEAGDPVPFATWDPDSPLGAEEGNGTRYSKWVEPLRVELREGDMLYLPAQWYHKVSQSCSEEGICVAVNYWHDMEFGGGFWPMCNFVRDVGLAATSGTGGS
ncbi:phospholipase A2 protein family [Drepanopeziza brunnea f. sp. 'multigermtubi' MB_m1]|uniref:Phospholipase A2 protein family n=1 Tax=Marssonina brunnea f. sp. multigermtubi (strain MB_m1) TaxID=1072389 RepID=K1X4H6_MARBU|nr:phospholipase A2 protein family [Drepanopeziza brunnea f. sp. 'multigermtubi' MB_m1]EKD19977.1 phospholipase A2 protein family [Drepanopeziza brunnea f. sp. 'multigermtubi' MB_m1]